MDQIGKDIIKLLKQHNLMSVSKLMVEYFRATNRHLYWEVENLGYRSVHHFLTYFDELIVEMDFTHTFDIHVRLAKTIKNENTGNDCNRTKIKIEIPEEKQDPKPTTPVIRSYETAKDDSQVAIHPPPTVENPPEVKQPETNTKNALVPVASSITPVSKGKKRKGAAITTTNNTQKRPRFQQEMNRNNQNSQYLTSIYTNNRHQNQTFNEYSQSMNYYNWSGYYGSLFSQSYY